MNVNINKDGKKHKYKIKEWKELTLEKWAEVIAINKGSNVQEAVENVRLISDIYIREGNRSTKRRKIKT